MFIEDRRMNPKASKHFKEPTYVFIPTAHIHRNPLNCDSNKEMKSKDRTNGLSIPISHHQRIYTNCNVCFTSNGYNLYLEKMGAAAICI